MARAWVLVALIVSFVTGVASDKLLRALTGTVPGGVSQPAAGPVVTLTDALTPAIPVPGTWAGTIDAAETSGAVAAAALLVTLTGTWTPDGGTAQQIHATLADGANLALAGGLVLTRAGGLLTASGSAAAGAYALIFTARTPGADPVSASRTVTLTGFVPGKLTAGDGAAGDEFGLSVALAGDTALIGAPRDDDGGSDSGSAYSFTRAGGVWTQR